MSVYKSLIFDFAIKSNSLENYYSNYWASISLWRRMSGLGFLISNYYAMSSSFFLKERFDTLISQVFGSINLWFMHSLTYIRASLSGKSQSNTLILFDKYTSWEQLINFYFNRLIHNHVFPIWIYHKTHCSFFLI